MRAGQIGEMQEFQADIQGDISLTPHLESVVDRSFVLFRQAHEVSVRRPGRPPGADGTRLGWNIEPLLFCTQKKHWRFRPTGVPGGVGEGNTVRPGRRATSDAAHGFIETAVLQKVERGNPCPLVNGKQQGASADPVAPIEGGERPPTSCESFDRGWR